MPDNLNDTKTPCPRCKTSQPAGNKFCEVCGATMPVQRTCTKCGTAAASATLKFCEQCGAPFNQAAVVPPATPVPPPVILPEKPVVSVEPSSAPSPAEPQPVQEKADTEKPSWYIPPAGTKATPPSPPPSTGSLPSSAEKPAAVAEPKPVSPVKPPAAGTGIAGNKKIIIGAVAGIVILIIIALVVLPALNTTPATPGPAPSVPATTPSPPAAFSPSVTIPQPAGSMTPAASFTGAGSGVVSMVPGPTQYMPEATNVLITADKDVITGAVTVQIAGGPGRAVIKEVLGTVYRGDGQTSTGTINPALRSEEVVIPGSKGTDRVVVTVLLFSGEHYVVMDKLMTFRERG